MVTSKLLLVVFSSALLYSAQSHSFAREFTQDDDPSVFHAENSTAELCLFVYSRQGALMIQPRCMVSSSSHSAENSIATD